MEPNLDFEDIKVNIHLTRALKFSRRVSTLAGLWPQDPKKFENRKLKLLRIFLFLYCVIGHAFIIIFKALFLIVAYKNKLFATFTDLCQLSRVCCNLYKFIVLFSRQNQILNLINTFHNLHVPLHLKRYVSILKKENSKVSSRVLKRLLFLLLIMLVILLTSSTNPTDNEQEVEKREENFGFQVWNPFNVTEYPQSVDIIQSFVFFAYLPSNFGLLGFLSLYLSLTLVGLNILDHMKLVLYALHWRTGVVMRNGPEYRELDDAYQKRVYQTLTYVVKIHQKIISFVMSINSIFSDVILIDVWTIILAMCDTALHFFVNGWEKSVLPVKIFLLELSYFALICWMANELFIKSGETLQRAVCHASWWSWRTGSQRVARSVAIRCNTPLALHAGPFYKLSLDTFIALLGISFSYFIFLYQQWKKTK